MDSDAAQHMSESTMIGNFVQLLSKLEYDDGT